MAPDSIRAIVQAYAKVHGNLVKHDAGYPRPEKLDALVKAGRPEYGMRVTDKGVLALTRYQRVIITVVP